MSYLSFDLGVFSGAPVELYQFQLGTQYWTFTTGQTVQAYQGRDYQPIGFSRSQVEQDQEFGKARLSLETTREFPPALEFIPGTPDQIMLLTIFRKHRGDNEVITYWKGRVMAATFKGSKATLHCEPIFTTLRRAGLRAAYQIPCRHLLFGDGCNLVKATWRVSATLSYANGQTVKSAAFDNYADGYFSSGLLVAGNARRMITSHAGDTLSLTTPILSLAALDAVEVYPGCDHSLSTCDSKFSNAANYGGFPWIPIKNPFSGDAIY